MKRFRWQLVIILLTGLLVGVLLISQQPAVTTPVDNATQAPVEGGMYTEALIGSFKRLNPMLDGFNHPDHDVDRLIFCQLVRFDNQGLAQPDLAESWGMTLDGTIFNFSIRQNAKWHDGRPVTAEDILFTIDLMKQATSLVPEDVRSFWGDVEIKQLSSTFIQFRLPEAFAPFIDYLSFGVLPKHLLDGVTPEELVDDPFNLKPIGCGPYKFERFIVDNGIVTGVSLTANSDYYQKKPFLNRVVFNYYPDSQTAWQAYVNGEVEGIGHIEADVLSQVLADQNLSLYSGRQPRLAIIYLNLKNPDLPFFLEASFRQALMRGLNRQRIIDTLLNGQAVLADNPILPGSWAYYEGLEGFDYDLPAALKLLADAGFAQNTEGILLYEEKQVQFQLMVPQEPLFQSIAESVQRDWQALGIQVELIPTPYDQLVVDHLEPRDYQAALVEIDLSNSPDPDPYPFWDQAMATVGQNYAQWEDKTASDYLEQARITVDIGERMRLYHNFQVLFAKELPSLPLYYPIYNYAITSRVQGVQVGPLFDPADRFNGIVDWFLLAKKASEPTVPATAIP